MMRRKFKARDSGNQPKYEREGCDDPSSQPLGIASRLFYHGVRQQFPLTDGHFWLPWWKTGPLGPANSSLANNPMTERDRNA